MKTLKKLLFVVFVLSIFTLARGQENSSVSQRTPEQEASRQTERLQQELRLTQEQTKQIYEINLRYARARQISNTRSQAIERMKTKSADIQRVLNVQQNERLQSIQCERRTAFNSSPIVRMSPKSGAFYSTPEYRQGAPYRSEVPPRVEASGTSRRITPYRNPVVENYERRGAPTVPTYPSSPPSSIRQQSVPSYTPTTTRSSVESSTRSGGTSSRNTGGRR